MAYIQNPVGSWGLFQVSSPSPPLHLFKMSQGASVNNLPTTSQPTLCASPGFSFQLSTGFSTTCSSRSLTCVKNRCHWNISCSFFWSVIKFLPLFLFQSLTITNTSHHCKPTEINDVESPQPSNNCC